jgi:hypothetical protein
MNNDQEYAQMMAKALRRQIREGQPTEYTFDQLDDSLAMEKPLTPQEMEFQAGDNEFEQEIASRMGPMASLFGTEGLPIEDYKTFFTEHSDHMTGLGRYLGKEAKQPKTIRYPYNEEGKRSEYRDATLNAGELGAFGVDATPDVQAHEFRHKLFDDLDKSFTDEEYVSRLHDLYSARTKEEFDDTLELSQDRFGKNREERLKNLNYSLKNMANSEYRYGARTPITPDSDTWRGDKKSYKNERDKQSYWAKHLRGK